MKRSRPVTLLAAAERDINEAVAWYDGQRPGLGDAFVRDVGERLERIEAYPESHQVAVGRVRRAVLHGFPYSVLYRVLRDRVEVVAVLHSHADPTRVAARRRPPGRLQ